RSRPILRWTPSAPMLPVRISTSRAMALGGRVVKIRVQRGPFLKGCRLVDRALPERLVEPAAGRLLLQAREGACTLQVVGNQVGLRLDVPAVVEEAGEALLPARQALAVVREVTAEEFSLESAPGRVRAWGEGAEFLLDSPAADRPLQ